jgi:uncharacterized protein (TIGR02246 family)
MPAKTPQECDELFARYVGDGDANALVALYEKDASLVSPDGTIARGTEAIRKAMERLAAMRATLTIDIKRVVALGDDLAAVYNDWTFTGKRPDGSAMETAGKALEVMRRQRDGTWLILFDDPRARG